MSVSELWEHQKKAIALAENKDELALFFEVGTGKTRTTIEIIRRKFAASQRILPTIILCPKIVCSQWKKQFAQYSKIPPQAVVILKGSQKQRLSMFLKETTDTRSKIFITNFEAVEMKELFEKLMEFSASILVVDESHRCKSIKSKRAKQVTLLAERAKYRYILTGTPVLNSGMDIFQQFKILDLGKTFGANFYAFRGKYFEDANSRWAGKPNYFPKWEPRPETYAELSKRMASKAVYAKKSECLDLPPLVRETIEVELGKEQFKLYKQMLNDYVAFLQDAETKESKAVVAELAITKALRLRQILSGFIKTDKGEEILLEDCPRADALEELLEDLTPNHKIIVWACFKQDYIRIRGICERLGVKYAELHGEIKDKDAELEKWVKPECRVMLANQGAGGIGINLIESDVSIYYSKSFSLEHDLQSEARNYRSGSEIFDKVTRIDLVVEGTLDSVITEALMLKQDIGEKILEWIGKLG